MDRRVERARSGPGPTAPALALVLGLAACQPAQHAPAAEPPGPPIADPSQPIFQRPPVVEQVTAGPGGSQVVGGLAAPDSRIRAVTTDPGSFGATAGHDGRFSLQLPPVGRSRLVRISIEAADRSTPATGWLFVPPDQPERSVLLRPGTAAVALQGAGLIAAVDYDTGGGAAISGRTKPNATVYVSVDGEKATETRAGPNGGWSAHLPNPLQPGAHVLHVQAPDGRIDRTIVLQSRKAAGVFQATREADDWRVDWTPPGGGAQTTLVLTGRAS